MVSSFKEGYMKVDGYKIHYLRYGDKGPKLVLIHSMGMDAHGFDMFSDEVKDEYQILALDILGHGDSSIPETLVSIPDHAELMRRCYRQLDFVPNIIIGHSVGGMMGMVLAAEHPEELEGLVLVDIAPRESRGPRPSRPPPPEYFKDENEARRYFRQRYTGFVDEAVANRIKNALTTDEEGRLVLKPIGDAIRPSLDVNLWPYAERIEIPTVLIKGGESTSITDERIERLRRHIPGFQAVTVEGATHMVPQDKPKEFKQQVINFIESISH